MNGSGDRVPGAPSLNSKPKGYRVIILGLYRDNGK